MCTGNGFPSDICHGKENPTCELINWPKTKWYLKGRKERSPIRFNWVTFVTQRTINYANDSSLIQVSVYHLLVRANALTLPKNNSSYLRVKAEILPCGMCSRYYAQFHGSIVYFQDPLLCTITLFCSVGLNVSHRTLGNKLNKKDYKPELLKRTTERKHLGGEKV